MCRAIYASLSKKEKKKEKKKKKEKETVFRVPSATLVYLIVLTVLLFSVPG